MRTRLWPCAVLLFAGASFAQDKPAGTPDPQPAAPEAAPAPTPQEQLASALSKARNAYRAGPIAETVALRVFWPDGREVKSTVILRVDAGDEASRRSRRIKLDLGRLLIAADDQALVAINTQDPGTYFRAELPEGLTLAALRGVAPRIPLPQIDWALNDATEPLDPSRALGVGRPVAWSPQITMTRTGEVMFRGGNAGGSVELTLNDRTGRLVHLAAPIGAPGSSGQAKLEMDVSSTPSGAAAGDEWTIQTAGRTAVAFLAELKGKAPDLTPGSWLPDLSLMTKDFEKWSLQQQMSNNNAEPVLVTRERFGVLVLYRVLPGDLSADAQAGVKALSSLKALVAEHWPDAAKRPQLVGAIIPSLDLQDFNRARLATVDAQWLGSAPPRYFSPSGGAVIERLAHKAAAALVLIDSNQRVVGTINLDGRAGQDAMVAQEAEKLIETAMGPLP
jgi:hypothetical protein